MIRPSDPRDDVRVTFDDSRVFSAPIGTPLSAIRREAYPDEDDPVLAVISGGRLRELAEPVYTDLAIRPVRLSSSDGIRIYSRGLSLVLIVAAAQQFPDAAVRIEYSVPHGGLFCRTRGRQFSREDLAALRARMEDLIRADLPIVRQRCTRDEAIARFRAKNEESKIRTLAARPKDHFHFYELDGVSDYFFGYMVASTGVLKTFGLEPFADGFVLRLPRREDPTRLRPARRFTALREVFDEHGEWVDLLGIRTVGSINDAIRSGRMEQIVLVAEALHEKRIAQIAHQIAHTGGDGIRLVLIAGPSASGKTTFSKRLAVQLLAEGLQPFPLAMDHYYLPRDLLEERQGSNLDFDALNALDVDRLRSDLQRLVAGERTQLPYFDFPTGKSHPGPTVLLGEKDVLLLEGIHGLNPALFPDGGNDRAFRIFVSALTQLNLDDHNRVSTTDTRLIRRIVRDTTYRGYTAEQTFELWDNVRAGEKRNIFPYQETADVMFNSALGYELAVLKPRVEPFLHRAIRSNYRVEAERLLALLWWFDAYDGRTVPTNSILREFIGGSILRDYTPEPLGGLSAGEKDCEEADA